jgi:hypothetical protein
MGSRIGLPPGSSDTEMAVLSLALAGWASLGARGPPRAILSACRARSRARGEPTHMNVRIGLGMATQPFSGPEALFRWVDLCEEGEIDSLWQTDRLISRQPYLEAMTTMAALAGATRRLRFGMNAVVVSLRDPLVLAKQCATIDYLSGGRLLPVFGVGS